MTVKIMDFVTNQVHRRGGVRWRTAFLLLHWVWEKSKRWPSGTLSHRRPGLFCFFWPSLWNRYVSDYSDPLLCHQIKEKISSGILNDCFQTWKTNEMVILFFVFGNEETKRIYLEQEDERENFGTSSWLIISDLL